MSTTTTNFSLVKPDLTDAADITAMNPNWDRIDAELAIRAKLNPDGKVPLEQLPEISSANSTTVTLTAAGWTLGADGRYAQTVSVTDVFADTEMVLVDVDLTTDDEDARITYLEAWALPSANEVDQGNGTLTFYAWEIPTVNIPVNVGVM